MQHVRMQHPWSFSGHTQPPDCGPSLRNANRNSLPATLRPLSQSNPAATWLFDNTCSRRGDCRTVPRCKPCSSAGRGVPVSGFATGFRRFPMARNVSSLADENGRVDWLLQDIVSPFSGRMDALLLDAPAGRCLLTLLLGAASLPGQVGHIRIEVKGQPTENAPLIASFDITAQGDDFNEHIFDLVFASAPTVPPTRWVAMILEPGSGLDIVRFGSLSFGPAGLVKK
jgi:hypothetical protein